MKRLVIVGAALVVEFFPAIASAAGLNPSAIFTSCQAAANATPSAVRGAGKKTKMWCAVVDREGQLLVIESTDTGGTPAAPANSDAWRGSIEIAIAKAYTAMAFSSNDQALDSRTVGLLTREDGPGKPGRPFVGTDSGRAPLFGLSDTNPFRGSSLGVAQNGDDATASYHHGIVTFAGGQPVYDCSTHALLGAVGVSGDGVDEDDTVAKGAVTGAAFCLTP